MQEVTSTVKIGEFTVLPIVLNQTDDYLYTQYTRMPFTSSSGLDRSYQLASEVSLGSHSSAHLPSRTEARVYIECVHASLN